jgi:small GTP-binding protein
MKTINILGDGGVGKTALTNYLRGIDFNPKYEPNECMVTSSFDETFILRDTAGQSHNAFVLPADATILMFDVTNKRSYENLGFWCGKVLDPSNPIIVVGNKCDIDDRKMNYGNTRYHRTHKMAYFDISSKNGYNIDKLVEHLYSKLA